MLYYFVKFSLGAYLEPLHAFTKVLVCLQKQVVGLEYMLMLQTLP
jgi:hypothetical protein